MEPATQPLTATAVANKGKTVLHRLHLSAMVVFALIGAYFTLWGVATFPSDTQKQNQAEACLNRVVATNPSATAAEAQATCHYAILGNEVVALGKQVEDNTSRLLIMGGSWLPLLLTWGLGAWVRYLFKP